MIRDYIEWAREDDMARDDSPKWYIRILQLLLLRPNFICTFMIGIHDHGYT
jgi:hypothetical protein